MQAAAAAVQRVVGQVGLTPVGGVAVTVAQPGTAGIATADAPHALRRLAQDGRAGVAAHATVGGRPVQVGLTPVFQEVVAVTKLSRTADQLALASHTGGSPVGGRAHLATCAAVLRIVQRVPLAAIDGIAVAVLEAWITEQRASALVAEGRRIGSAGAGHPTPVAVGWRAARVSLAAVAGRTVAVGKAWIALAERAPTRVAHARAVGHAAGVAAGTAVLC
jgi:hypothetical protein